MVRKLLAAVLFAAISQTATAHPAVPVLAEYSEALRASGRRMVLAVIPPREETERAGYSELIGELAEAGVEIADISGAFTPAAWCLTDTHPLPEALRRAAAETARHLALSAGDKSWETESFTVAFSGNLRTGCGETLSGLRIVGGPAAIVADSEIVVAGDSNALIYHDGADAPVRDAGYADWLAFFLKRPVTLAAMRGNCADALRVELRRRFVAGGPRGLGNMKILVLLLDSKQFREGANRWRVIPPPAGER